MGDGHKDPTIGFSYEKITLFIISAVKQKGERLAAFLKARPRRQHNHRYWVGAAHRLLCSTELAKFTLSHGQGTRATQDRPEGQAVQAAQRCTAQAWAHSP